MSNDSLTTIQKFTLLILSFCLVAFGQPAWVWWFGLLSALGGYACFWRVLLTIPGKFHRFLLAMGWFAGVQIVQLSWAISHPYLYIYAILLIVVSFMGAQWGIIALWITPKAFQRIFTLMALAGLWTILEWSRLFVLSGFPFDPIGLSLTGSLYPLQLASVGGIYLLTYWVMLANLLALRAWIQWPKTIPWVAFALFALFPYGFGAAHLQWHEKDFDNQSDRSLAVLLVQTAFPVEEKLTFQSYEEASQFVLEQWHQIFKLVSEHRSEHVDLILMPENLVPYGTYGLIFPLSSAVETFTHFFGSDALRSLPPVEPPFADLVQVGKEVHWYVNNAFLSQGLANLWQAHLVIGLEDQLYRENEKEETYSAALHFQPNNQGIHRYEKRVLVPMGEYIPFDSCRQLAAKYGVYGSFTPGKEARLFAGPIPLGPSICYEEAFGHLMKDNRHKGAEMLVNLTNDGWYPHSKLPQQHFDHARLRTVENGIPLVRACNTGITGALDSLGR
ncbi:MAG: apolipoprotein N-acyltransferase, partial [Chlamydiales bacterium]